MRIFKTGKTVVSILLCSAFFLLPYCTFAQRSPLIANDCMQVNNLLKSAEEEVYQQKDNTVENIVYKNNRDTIKSTVSGNVYNDIVKGTVYNQQNVILAGVYLQLEGMSDLGNVVFKEVYTDNNGLFDFGNIEIGKYELYYKDAVNNLTKVQDIVLSNSACETNIFYLDIKIGYSNLVRKTGRVYNNKNNQEISDVIIVFKNINNLEEFKTSTDAEGNYVIDLPEGNYEVTLSRSGFNTIKTNMIIN